MEIGRRSVRRSTASHGLSLTSAPRPPSTRVAGQTPRSPKLQRWLASAIPHSHAGDQRSFRPRCGRRRSHHCDSTAWATLPFRARAYRHAIRDSDFADDEREHEAYTFGDDLGLVRVGSSGTIALRDVPFGGAPPTTLPIGTASSAPLKATTTRSNRRRMATQTPSIIVYTREAEDPCPDLTATAEGVRALRVDRKTHVESRLDLAPTSCDRSVGPFWIAFGPDGPIVAWVERATGLAAAAAPVSRVVFRILATDSVRDVAVGCSRRRHRRHRLGRSNRAPSAAAFCAAPAATASILSRSTFSSTLEPVNCDSPWGGRRASIYHWKLRLCL